MPGMAESDRLPLWKKGCFTLLLLLALLAAAEVALRVWAPPWTTFENHVAAVYEPHPRWGYRYVPGAEDVLSRYGDFSQMVRIGPHGWRGPAPAAQAAPGVYRIVVVGDSHAAGLEVGEGETFPAVLEGALARRTGLPVEVVNLGLDGTGTRIQGRVLEEAGLGLGPDLVVLQVFLNDFADTVRPLTFRDVVEGQVIAYASDEERALLAEQARRRARSALRPLARFSYIARALRFAREGRVPENYLEVSRDAEGGSRREQVPRQVMAVAAEIERMATASAEAGAGFAVVSYPAGWILVNDLDPRLPSVPVQVMGRRMGRIGIPVLDLRPVFLEATPDPSVFFFLLDSHPNAMGHALAADATARWLVEEGLGPRGAETGR